jgi:hypothetical protein
MDTNSHECQRSKAGTSHFYSRLLFGELIPAIDTMAFSFVSIHGYSWFN